MIIFSPCCIFNILRSHLLHAQKKMHFSWALLKNFKLDSACYFAGIYTGFFAGGGGGGGGGDIIAEFSEASVLTHLRAS